MKADCCDKTLTSKRLFTNCLWWKMKNTSSGNSSSFGGVRQIMVEYVRGTPPDRWHWCKNCSQYPLYVYQRRHERPDSDLCDECETKEHKQQCKPKNHRMLSFNLCNVYEVIHRYPWQNSCYERKTFSPIAY
jgi:hypothetical protein